ncbi:MAG TPA: hypothetical protein VFC46_06530, partial [Humisphaera sp.]|nr:hypothetical protein [Humisphaera sp.]
ANAAAITVGGALKSLQISSATGVSVMATGAIQKIQAGTWNSTGMISAPSIKSINILGPATIDVNTAVLHTLKVRGALTGSQLTLTGPGTMDLASLTAASISNTAIDASGNLGAIKAATLTGSRIGAGIASSVILPASAADFAAASTIASVTLKKTAGAASFVDSTIAAGTIKKASLGGVQYSNGGMSFGVGAQGVNSLTFADPTSGKSATFNRVTSESIVAADLAAKGISPQDFVIRIV